MSHERIGTIAALHRYPVKSMAGEALQQASLGWNGLEHDRRYAFVQTRLLNGFPWLTARQLPQMLLHVPRITGGNPSAPDVMVATPDGRELPLASDDLRNALEAASCLKVHLLSVKRGIFDTAPVSLISTGTAQQLAQETGAPADPRRYRPNIVIDTLNGFPFEENDWVNRLLCFGEGPNRATLHVVGRDVRCVMINLDPDTAEANTRLFKTVVQKHESYAGIYGNVHAPGELHVGDAVYLQT
jgi:hypothetical protein